MPRGFEVMPRDTRVRGNITWYLSRLSRVGLSSGCSKPLCSIAPKIALDAEEHDDASARNRSVLICPL